MKVLLIIGITLVLCIAMILICGFLSEKGKTFIDKIIGRNK